ncbi:hypothetical protein PoB_000758500 [Plakobranchus ocellatus]|uniref:FLYWCH-type domain-containing protein n=1 Tax=Plakobranchus ocellatus TaxID=259542 RepID=A0AAV3YDG4_9GAST|nr:hypothetical protein PoB_000758500 [Plakobranchus ocellatus]
MLKTGGGGTAEPMDKMSEGIIDVLPNQFAAIKNEFVEDYILEKGKNMTSKWKYTTVNYSSKSIKTYYRWNGTACKWKYSNISENMRANNCMGPAVRKVSWTCYN